MSDQFSQTKLALKMTIIEVLITIATIIVLVIIYFKWSFNYWKHRNVPYKEPSIPFGNNDNFLKRVTSYGQRCKGLYDYFKQRGEKHGGCYFFTSPIYIPVDPEYIKNVMVKDFDYFCDRGIYTNEKSDPLSANVFQVGGARWKRLRVKMSPTLSSAKIKMMFHILSECSQQMATAVDRSIENNKPIAIKELMSCFATDVICSSAFGIECDSCNDPNEEFRKQGKKVVQFSKLKSIRNSISIAFPQIGRLLGLRLFDEEMSNYFINLVKQNVEFRDKTHFYRKDAMQIMMEQRQTEDGNKADGLTMEEIAVQAFVFIVAGYETSASTLAYIFFELAINQNIQNKAREEVLRAVSKHDEELTYECVQGMHYLQQIMDGNNYFF